MNTSQSEDVQVGESSMVARMLLVAGVLVGLAVLALLMSGTADAAESSSPDRTDRPGLLSAIGKPLRGTIEQAKPVLRPVTDVVHTVSSQVAPVAKPVTELVEPVLAPVVRPVVTAVAPVLSVVRPVTEPVLRPVLDALAPVTEPVVHAVGADPAGTVVAGSTETTGTTRPRDDVRPAPAEQAAAVTTEQPEAEAVVPPRQPRADRPAFAEDTAKDAGVPAGFARMSGPAGGGSVPPAPEGPAASGTVSAGPAGQHGGEHAVTMAGSGPPGTDRAWRAPPGGRAPLYWLVFYGNDHPS
ncbi:hypothetical protein Q5425_44555 [Amycolatopsis sp. A133]|uniref:hypothetical protein n=1 Tax=Amycolatopsis sp. A133 TaxID=3064472 RepID=UPI0027F516D6|nr:hypothetical protein [Amycolatopsis sp. A133]MDQ7810839.1 hypothetical protein [Amycolatopsis sp. A133]